MLPKIKPIFDKPPSNLCLHEPVAYMEIIEKRGIYNSCDIRYKCKHCDEIQQIENK